ncbi:outer membrane beta-barrel protein [Ferrimonas balearica]|uniref:outer membrane beta-barrel protein n=1 Tax=Ferrimonas balearica TaxID=44012 RepID=UPI001C997294|nr:outer membrane beta-barrel protein [Ferrimonas balearica]MBY5994268.1 outer membrane beta-barrel protein [Ferrimonas balearica]
MGWLLGAWASAGLAAEFEPARVDLGEGIRMEPRIGLEYGYDDNLLHSGADTLDSQYLRVLPEVRVLFGRRISHLRVDYLLDSTTYFDSSDDNYLDHTLDLTGHHEFTARHRVDANYEFHKGHQARGTGIAEFDQTDEPVEFTSHDVTGAYEFGALSARMQIGGNLGYYQRTYDNFRERSQYRDHDKFRYGATFKWRMGARTRLLLDLSETDTSYDRVEPGELARDSKVTRGLVGLIWEASAQSEGRAAFGIEDKRFDDSGREDFTGFAWDIAFTWRPTSYSTVDLISARETKDPFTDGDYVEESRYEITWEHFWQTRWGTSLGASYTDKDYTGDDREDEITRLRLGVIYDFRRWLRFEPYYSYRDNSSTRDDPELNYDKNQYGLMITVAL